MYKPPQNSLLPGGKSLPLPDTQQLFSHQSMLQTVPSEAVPPLPSVPHCAPSAPLWQRHSVPAPPSVPGFPASATCHPLPEPPLHKAPVPANPPPQSASLPLPGVFRQMPVPGYRQGQVSSELLRPHPQSSLRPGKTLPYSGFQPQYALLQPVFHSHPSQESSPASFCHKNLYG